MCQKPKAGEKVVEVRSQPKSYSCPTCGRRGHRKRRLDRYVRSLADGKVLWLHVFYAEYTAHCGCRKYCEAALNPYALGQGPWTGDVQQKSRPTSAHIAVPPNC
jgi:hypothetical protein